LEIKVSLSPGKELKIERRKTLNSVVSPAQRPNVFLRRMTVGSDRTQVRETNKIL
jgi:hypothetical protein